MSLLSKEEFGYVSHNDWPLLVLMKAKIYGYAGERLRQEHLKPAVFKTAKAAEKVLEKEYKTYLRSSVAINQELTEAFEQLYI